MTGAISSYSSHQGNKVRSGGLGYFPTILIGSEQDFYDFGIRKSRGKSRDNLWWAEFNSEAKHAIRE